MITLSITFSSGTQTIYVPAPVDDQIQLHYGQCDYCSRDMRHDRISEYPGHFRFCSTNHRQRFHQLGIGQVS